MTEVENNEPREVPQFGRNHTRELIVHEVEISKGREIAQLEAMRALFSFLRIWDKSPAKVVRLAHDLNSDIRSLKARIKSTTNIANLNQLKATVKWLEEFHHVAPLKDRFFGVAKFGFESFLVGFEPPINTECLSDL